MEAEGEVKGRFVAGNPIAAIVLGNDAVVAARPCAPIQLARACMAAGFDIVVPPIWGDELIAGGFLAQLANRDDRFTVGCACPRVRSLLDAATVEPPSCVSLAPPPIAAARYLRAVHGDALLITYVGDCPAASDPSIDARFSPAGFLASLQREGISISAQTTAVSKSDGELWTRHFSTPGGLPALRFLARDPVSRVLREIDASAFGAGLPTSRSNVLLDLTIAAGCVCGNAKDQIADFEPPRSLSPVLGVPAELDLSPGPSAPRVRTTRRPRNAPTVDTPVAVPNEGAAPERVAVSAAPVVVEQPLPIRSESPATGAAPASGPIARQPPRAAPAPGSTARQPPRAAPGTSTSPRKPARGGRRRALLLVVLPIAVLGAASALGIGAYRTSASGRRTGLAANTDRVGAADSATRNAARGDVGPSSSSIAPPAPGASAMPSSAQAVPTPATPLEAIDSGVARPDRLTRRRAVSPQREQVPEVVPGWLPQGQRAFAPDSAVLRRRDSTAVRPPDSTSVPRPRRDSVPPA